MCGDGGENVGHPLGEVGTIAEALCLSLSHSLGHKLITTHWGRWLTLRSEGKPSGTSAIAAEPSRSKPIP